MKTLKDLIIRKKFTRVSEDEEYRTLMDEVSVLGATLAQQLKLIRKNENKKYRILGTTMATLERLNASNFKSEFQLKGAHIDSILKAVMELSDLIHEKANDGELNYIESNLQDVINEIQQQLEPQKKEDKVYEG